MTERLHFHFQGHYTNHDELAKPESKHSLSMSELIQFQLYPLKFLSTECNYTI